MNRNRFKHFLLSTKCMRSTAMLLVAAMLLFSLTSCFASARIWSLMQDLNPSQQPQTGTTGAENLQYTLNEEDVGLFYERLQACETLTLAGTDASAIEAAWELLEAQYYYIATQAQIAYVLYCCDTADETLETNYLSSSEIQSEIYHAYMTLCQTIDASASPYRDTFFSDWTQADLDSMRLYSEEIVEMMQKNDRILVDFRKMNLSENGEAFQALYREAIQNHNAMAQALGYSDYYEYASKSIYLRDYGEADLLQMRQYVKDYVVPLCSVAYKNFSDCMSKLSYFQQIQAERFLTADYDSLSTDYLSRYLSCFDEDTRTVLNSMLDNAVFCNGESAYQGAFTTYLYDMETPLCYFGPSYQSILTVVHELGHYYADSYTPYTFSQLDLAETQSQANELLMLAYLKNEMDSGVYEAVVSYQLYSMLSTVILSTVIDEFECFVYTNADELLEAGTDFDTVIDEICESYGGKTYITENITDVNLYWKYVTVESPVYYISYATSAIASLDLFRLAQSDFSTALTTYRHLAEEVRTDAGFLQNLTDAGLTGPFQPDVYLFVTDFITQSQ